MRLCLIMDRTQIEHVGIRQHPSQKNPPQPPAKPLEGRTCKLCDRSFNATAKNQVHCARCKKPHTQWGRWIRIKKGAEIRGHAFELTLADLRPHWQKDCTYCGTAIRSVQLDRVDNTRGYWPDNVASCCFPCNQLKGSMGQPEFIALVHRIATHQDLKERREAETLHLKRPEVGPG